MYDASKLLPLLVVLHGEANTWKIFSFEQLWQMHFRIFSTYSMNP